jgi:hypothetical protein
MNNDTIADAIQHIYDSIYGVIDQLRARPTDELLAMHEHMYLAVYALNRALRVLEPRRASSTPSELDRERIRSIREQLETMHADMIERHDPSLARYGIPRSVSHAIGHLRDAANGLDKWGVV